MNNTRQHAIIAAISLGLALPLPANAGSKVDFINLQSGGIHIDEGKIHVNNNGNQFTATTQNSVPFYTEVKAGCKGNDYALKELAVTFNQNWSIINKAVGNELLGEAGGISTSPLPFYYLLKKQIPYTDVKLDIPLNVFANNNSIPDPVQACNALLQEKLGQGVSKQQFFNSQHTIKVPLTLQSYAACGKNDIHSYGLDSLNKELIIICKKAEGGGWGGGMNIQAQPKGPIANANNVQTPTHVSQAKLETVQGQTYQNCPASVVFAGAITTTGATSVKYRFKDFKGTTTNTQTLSFDSAGTKPVQQIFNYNMNFSFQGWAQLEVLEPNTVSSAQANFVVQCKSTPHTSGQNILSPQSLPKPMQIQAPTQHQGNQQADPRIQQQTTPPRAEQPSREESSRAQHAEPNREHQPERAEPTRDNKPERATTETKPERASSDNSTPARTLPSRSTDEVPTLDPSGR